MLLVAEAFANEKDMDKEVVFSALEYSLAVATAKRHENNIDVRVEIDRKTGEYKTYRRWKIVDENTDIDTDVEYPESQILLETAKIKNPDSVLGEFVEEEIESIVFCRISAQIAKQAIIQKIKELERKKIFDTYKDKVGELITGVVKHVKKGNVYIDLSGDIEAYIPSDHMIPKDSVKIGSWIRGYLKEVRSEAYGPQLFVSRVVPELLIAMFKLEVPEIGEGLIEILGAARDPGSRAKIAVKSNSPRLDPIGTCVGMMGSRVQAVSNELAGERIDIILWDENSAQFVINAMSPAEIETIIIDEDKHSMDVSVTTDNLSQAIGRGGQNVRLAEELTNWKLDVRDSKDINEDNAEEMEKIKQTFMDKLDIDKEIATVLVKMGLTSVEEVAYIPVEEITEVEGFDEELIEAIRNRAKDVVLINAIASEETIETSNLDSDILKMEDMDVELAKEMAANGILTMEDLANQAIDELLVFSGMDEKRAGKLIMKAREPWFKNGQQSEL